MKHRRSLRPTLALALLGVLALSATAWAQHQHPAPAPPAAAVAAAAAAPAPAAAPAVPAPAGRPSPMALARISLGDAYLSVVYSRPSKRGRANIFGTKEGGALVPDGELWRTGANEATEITVTRDVVIGGKTLAAGTYSLFTTPDAERWKIHFNSALGGWGTGGYDAAKDVLVVEVAAGTLAEEVEQFTIELAKSGDSADLVLKWVTTEVRVPVKRAG